MEEQSSILKKLSNAIKVIPVGSEIECIDSNETFIIKKIIISEKDHISYVITTKTDLKKTYNVDEANVIVKKLSNKTDVFSYRTDEDKPITVSDNNETLDVIAESINSIATIISGMDDEIWYICQATGGKARIKRREGSSKEDIAIEDVPHINFIRTTANIIVNDSLILAGEFYIYIRYPDDRIEYLSIERKLKPLHKRIFNTLLYGRDHISNYNTIESMFDFRSRYKNHIQQIVDTEYKAVLITGEYALS